MEAPFLFHHNNYYYLFVSFDYCCRGEKSDYHVVVGRSPKINGPYVDRNGIDMADGGGTLVIAPDSIYAGAGHSAAYHFNNKDYFVCHGYDLKDEGASKLIMKEIFWDEEDWPTLQPTVLANINEQ